MTGDSKDRKKISPATHEVMQYSVNARVKNMTRELDQILGFRLLKMVERAVGGLQSY